MNKKLLFLFSAFFVSFAMIFVNTNQANASDKPALKINKVSKTYITGHSSKLSVINSSVGKTTKTDNHGYFTIKPYKNFRYGKLQKFTLVQGKQHQNIYFRLYDTNNVNIKNNKQANNYLRHTVFTKPNKNIVWGAGKQDDAFIVMTTNNKLKMEGYTGVDYPYTLYPNGIIMNN
ncbi:hypothetical protein MOO46_05545 [Apilactobacillus apisilvae]|uniref:Uncharacterized protein n=1 Tax=Apilactobacillus apisilvae TaxID=2923364 RepID=A0ABY4PGI4_9LACO|nr:hypothetical protein [Apilactobacillus apisilvae]UQS84712.1 hypothetical protein MOO46_05545 [Apilactobacillus apisilvae]